MPKQLVCPLGDMAGRHGDSPAVIDDGSVLTFGELNSLADQQAAWLDRNGIGKGDRIALLGSTSAPVLALTFALLRRDAVAVLPSLRWPHQLLIESLESVSVTAAIIFGKSEPDVFSRHVQTLVYEPNGSDQFGDAPSSYEYSVDQPATICFTSGSTGGPKAALHTFGNHIYSALGSNTNIPFGPGDRWLISLPLYHVGGLSILFRSAVGGGACVVAEPADNLTERIKRHEITHVSLVSTQLRRLLDSIEKSPSSFPRCLKSILIGGGPVPEKLIERAVRLGLPVYRTYGLTEMASQVATSADNRAGSVQCLPHREIKLSDQGEIFVKGETLFAGYVSGDNLDPSVDAKGWFATGDIGEQLGDKSIRVIGRKDNMFISGGENIHPEMIERALLALEGITQAIVVPIEDENHGQRPVAFVDAETEPDSSEVSDQLRTLVPGYMLPISYHALPTDQSGSLKPDRTKLQRLAVKLAADSQ